MSRKEEGRQPIREENTASPNETSGEVKQPQSYHNMGQESTCEKYGDSLPEKLYSAFVDLDHFERKSNVHLELFITGRTALLAPCEQLIENYGAGDHEIFEDLYYMQRINQLFTLVEAQQLQQYAKDRYGWDVQLEEISLPWCVGEGPSLPKGEHFLVCPEIPVSWVSFPRDEGYWLPFNLQGVYEIETTIPSRDRLDPDAAKRAARYLHLALDRLSDLETPIPEAELESVAQELFKNHRLRVMGGAKRDAAEG
jgi:hypothetical protein